jgi:ligand-binding sensor domain-containing protein
MMSMLKKIFLCTLSLLLLATGLFAQVPSPLIFSRVTKKDGLASSMTFHTTRDKEGFLWIATQNGLQRYDGNRFLTFRHLPGDSTSIAENSINRLFIDKKNRLWLLFDNQVGIFNMIHFSFTQTKINTPVGMVRKIVEDNEGRIILLADSKQFLYDESKKSIWNRLPFACITARLYHFRHGRRPFIGYLLVYR